MKEQVKTGILIGVALLTLFNTYQISTMDTYGASVSKAVAKRADEKKEVKAEKVDVAQISSPLASQKDQAKFDPLTEKVTKPSGPKTTVRFDKYEHDFGNIAQNSTHKYVFSFTNTGKEPLLITNAKGSCGCTVPRYPKEPIAPGKNGEIEIVYKPGRQKNKQSKTITISANTEPDKTILKVKANVIPDDPSTPAVN